MNQGDLFDPGDPPCPACGLIGEHRAGCPRAKPPQRAPGQFPETKKGIKRADDNANVAWMTTAREVAIRIARQFPKFTSADVDLAMQRDFPTILTHEKRAMGAVIRALFKENVAVNTEEFVQDPRPNCHNQNKRVLRSLIYEQRTGT